MALSNPATNEELEAEGFQLCEFGGDCDVCQEEVAEGELFFEQTTYETIEGNYVCRKCAVKKIEEQEKFYDDFTN